MEWFDKNGWFVETAIRFAASSPILRTSKSLQSATQKASIWMLILSSQNFTNLKSTPRFLSWLFQFITAVRLWDVIDEFRVIWWIFDELVSLSTLIWYWNEGNDRLIDDLRMFYAGLEQRCVIGRKSTVNKRKKSQGRFKTANNFLVCLPSVLIELDRCEYWKTFVTFIQVNRAMDQRNMSKWLIINWYRFRP